MRSPALRDIMYVSSSIFFRPIPSTPCIESSIRKVHNSLNFIQLRPYKHGDINFFEDQ